MLTRVVSLALLLLCFGVAPAAANEFQAPQQVTSAVHATVDDIARSPADWYGKTVTVRAKVDDVFARTLFEAEHEGLLGFGEDLLIVVPRPDSFRRHGEWVTITGTVRRFVKAEIERTYSGDDWSVPDEVMLQFDDRPSIVASSVVPAEARAVPETAGAGATTYAAIEQIAENPDEWYGKTVTVRGKVDDIFHRNVFDVEEGGFMADDELLVIAPLTAPMRQSGEWISVTGRVSRFVDLDLEKLRRDDDSRLPDEVALQFEKRTAIVAAAVTPVMTAGQ